MKPTLAKTLFIFLIVLAAATVLALSGSAPEPTGAPAAQVDPDQYPEIGDQELGQLRWALQTADQDLMDFTNYEAMDQLGMTAYRYAIAFSAYLLATEQYHKLPACPEIIQPRLDRLISKLVTKPAWEFWAEVSQGVPKLEPLMNKPYPEERDPVAKDNIMYSGHLGHMIGLYEMLYRDFKWDEPGSIVFEWSADEKYVYDNHSLQKIMHGQMSATPHCIPCEPNACFPECNQHPVLSFMLYDQTHGTGLARVNQQFLDFFLDKKLIHPTTHRTAALYLVKQDLTLAQHSPRFGNALDLVLVPAVSLGAIKVQSASADGWTGAFMHAWQPDYIERHYPYQRDLHLVEMNEEEAELRRDIFEPRLYYGFFALLAAEVGDLETRDKLLAKADQLYGPRWNDGAMHYPFDKEKKCVGLTGTLLAFARANPPNGLWTMHNHPFDDQSFQEPKVMGVDFPRVVLRRAVYDRENQALIVTTEPGGQGGGSTSLRIGNLDPGRSYLITLDGREVNSVQGRKDAMVEVPLDGRHDLVMIES